MSLVTVNEQIKCSCNFDVCLQRNDLAEKEVDVSSVIISSKFRCCVCNVHSSKVE